MAEQHPEDVDPANKSTVLRFHPGKRLSEAVRLHSRSKKKKKNKERNYGNLTFAVFVPGFKCEQFPSSPLASAKLCRPLEEEVTFLASFRRPCSHMV